MPVTVVVDGYWTRSEPLKLSSRAAKVARRLRSRTPAKLYIYETLLERVAHNLKYIAFECGPPASALKPIMGQGRPFRGRFPDCDGLSSKFSASHSRRVSYTYNFADVLDLNSFEALAARLMISKD
jgi:hypothetical protein